jgi:hypothetical protein
MVDLADPNDALAIYANAAGAALQSLLLAHPHHIQQWWYDAAQFSCAADTPKPIAS